MKVDIRPYHPSDLTSLYRICVQTGDSGKDATHLYKDSDLLGHVYAAPYAILEADLCFILTVDSIPSGYILGCRNSEQFFKNSMNNWFNMLQNKYPKPKSTDTSKDAAIIKILYSGHIFKEELSVYPSHLHIDILPIAQGFGMGRKLINTFTDKLQDLQVKGVHLEVGKTNESAIAFYNKTGFHRIMEYDYSIAFAKSI